jgi:hypothetical protein
MASGWLNIGEDQVSWRHITRLPGVISGLTIPIHNHRIAYGLPSGKVLHVTLPPTLIKQLIALEVMRDFSDREQIGALPQQLKLRREVELAISELILREWARMDGIHDDVQYKLSRNLG